MTPPRRILEQSSYLITRRCSQRQFLLRPTLETNALILYVLAYCCRSYGIRLHAFCFLSNHYHLVVTDPKRRVCRFMQTFNSLVARALNARYGRRENFWSSEPPSLVHLVEREDVLDKIVYTTCNPVSSALVPHSRLWPGARSQPEDVGTTRHVEKPSFFFRKRGDTDESALLDLETPPGWESDEFRTALDSLVSEREASLRRELEESGRPFLGLRRLMKQHHDERARSAERPRNRVPHIACKRSSRRIEEIERWKRFVSDYRSSFADFCRGIRDVVFPAGTYLMREIFGVRCAIPPPGT